MPYGAHSTPDDPILLPGGSGVIGTNLSRLSKYVRSPSDAEACPLSQPRKCQHKRPIRAMSGIKVGTWTAATVKTPSRLALFADRFHVGRGFRLGPITGLDAPGRFRASASTGSCLRLSKNLESTPLLFILPGFPAYPAESVLKDYKVVICSWLLSLLFDLRRLTAGRYICSWE